MIVAVLALTGKDEGGQLLKTCLLEPQLTGQLTNTAIGQLIVAQVQVVQTNVVVDMV